MTPSPGPLLVFGPRSHEYDFGPAHPLTPLRFGPGIDLLRLVGARPGLAPSPASDEELLRLHEPGYLAAVRRMGADPAARGAMGIGSSDNPAFAGMHEAAATVAGGSLAAMGAILRGDVEHAFHPGGGLHHAMPASASGFCIYNDPALAIVRARDAGLRVLYVDLDAHHGDGVQAMTFDDPGTLTLSFHESGWSLFPGTGFVHEVGEGTAAGTAVNMPFEAMAGDEAWLAAVRSLLPSLAAVFGPALIVSQHGADAHAWDPLAHLRVTTSAMAEAARLVDAVAHRWASGRWLATGGGGYDAYRVVPRTWALTWLAGAHREPPADTPTAWRDQWQGAAALFGTPGMPATFLDAPNAGLPFTDAQADAEARSLATLAQVRDMALPRLVREAEDRGWWRPALGTASRVAASQAAGGHRGPEPVPAATPVIRALGVAELAQIGLVPRVVAPFDPDDALVLLRAAAVAGARVIGAVSGSIVVGLAVAAPSRPDALAGGSGESLLAIGVAPAYRRSGLAGRLLRALVDGRPPGISMEARITVAERDVIEPLAVEVRIEVARRLLLAAGFRVDGGILARPGTGSSAGTDVGPVLSAWLPGAS